jgi:hypothetical protein
LKKLFHSADSNAHFISEEQRAKTNSYYGWAYRFDHAKLCTDASFNRNLHVQSFNDSVRWLNGCSMLMHFHFQSKDRLRKTSIESCTANLVRTAISSQHLRASADEVKRANC